MTSWLPAAQQVDVWQPEAPPSTTFVFDPYVFDRRPIFDTGSSAGYWDNAQVQSEIWTPIG